MQLVWVLLAFKFVSVHKEVRGHGAWRFLFVCGPNNPRERKEFWDKLSIFMFFVVLFAYMVTFMLLGPLFKILEV